jgi:hypothetical protein
MNLRTQLLKRGDVRFGAREAYDLMSVCNEFLGRFAADKSGGAGNEYTREKTLPVQNAGIW